MVRCGLWVIFVAMWSRMAPEQTLERSRIASFGLRGLGRYPVGIESDRMSLVETFS